MGLSSVFGGSGKMEGHVSGCRKFPEGTDLLWPWGEGQEDRSIQADLTLDMEMPTN